MNNVICLCSMFLLLVCRFSYVYTVNHIAKIVHGFHFMEGLQKLNSTPQHNCVTYNAVLWCSTAVTCVPVRQL